ncbi:helix-turn-helix domain-containing protein [Aquamicrobium zhengzhouense]|uniref:helix-turn-helix domain-containing protein n=1 Tax=Aquamicrobium zhengzhouense TaxID=2781738 RepID=UPI001F42DFB4|nr:helix-turn-helix transcriptional regulator [Aquamicrobium zhengzhouense]
MPITYSQCRAARALADLSRDALASLSGVSAELIERFERRIETPDEGAVRSLQEALEVAGVLFLAEDGRGRTWRPVEIHGL